MSNQPEFALFVADCPRCGSLKSTFEVLASCFIGKRSYRECYECFLRCRSCRRPSNGLLRNQHATEFVPTTFRGQFANDFFALEEWVFEVPNSRSVPDHVPPEIGRIFKEGADCFEIGAHDAAGTMFRKVLDASTRTLLSRPESDEANAAPNWKVYKDLRLRLDWLFEKNLLSPSMEELAACIHQDGNDAAHDLNGIGKEEAEDLADFADQVLRMIYTVPGQIAANIDRRERRRSSGDA